MEFLYGLSKLAFLIVWMIHNEEVLMLTQSPARNHCQSHLVNLGPVSGW